MALCATHDVVAEPLALSPYCPCDYDGCDITAIVEVDGFRFCDQHTRRFIECVTQKNA